MVFKPTPLSKIEALAASNQSEALGDPGGPPPGQSPPPSPTKGQHGSTFVKEWVRKHLPSANGPRRWNNGLIYEFLCPWRESDGNSAFLADLPNGISAGCQHATCAGSRSTGNHWYDLRTLLEGPDWRKSDATEAKATSGFNDEAARPLIKFDTTEWGDRQPKEVQWLIDGQLALGETGLLAGPPNCGKGLLSIQIATAIATGSNLFGKKGPLTPMAVIMVQMAATNRLTGHSPGFFSVYSLPPNQAVSAERQRGINAKRNQVPSYRDTHTLILKKTKDLLKNLSQEQVDNLRRAAEKAQFLTSDAASTRSIRNASVQLTVTSPPFLDVVQYAKDNWLRCWFCGLDAEKTGRSITMAKTLPKWEAFIAGVFRELYRVTRPGGFVAFEVGEVRQGQVRLEEAVLPIGINAGFQAIGVLINEQQFTKTSQCWKVKNNHQGTNSNRIVLFGKGY